MLDDPSAISPIDAAPVPRTCEERDREILRLWDDKWSTRRIAGHLGIKMSAVAYAVRKNGRCRNPRGPRSDRVISFQDAPAEAWRQRILPDVIFPELTNTFGTFENKTSFERALVFTSLLMMKKYDDLASFIDWVCVVTSYDQDEIATFVERGARSHLIVDGQPNHDVLQETLDAENHCDFAFLIIAATFDGHFERTGDGLYFLPDRLTLHEATRWQDDGGAATAA
jgi:hypothetical protein